MVLRVVLGALSCWVRPPKPGQLRVIRRRWWNASCLTTSIRENRRAYGGGQQHTLSRAALHRGTATPSGRDWVCSTLGLARPPRGVVPPDICHVRSGSRPDPWSSPRPLRSVSSRPCSIGRNHDNLRAFAVRCGLARDDRRGHAGDAHGMMLGRFELQHNKASLDRTAGPRPDSWSATEPCAFPWTAGGESMTNCRRAPTGRVKLLAS
jgi:hypothetical protein